jgi:hypothetical protein
MATLADWKGRMGPRARMLFDRFVEMVAACGDYHAAPARTRVAFLGRVRFAAVTSVSEKGMTCGFSLPRPRRSARFASVEEVVPGWWVHRLRVTDVSELDEEVQSWIRESYRLMGMRERLTGGGRAKGAARKGVPAARPARRSRSLRARRSG